MREEYVGSKRESRIGEGGSETVYGRARRALLAFHREERGLQTVEAILIIGVAVIILLGLLKVFFPQLLNQVRQKIQQLFSSSVT